MIHGFLRIITRTRMYILIVSRILDGRNVPTKAKDVVQRGVPNWLAMMTNIWGREGIWMFV